MEAAMFLKMQNFSAFESLIIFTAVNRKKRIKGSKISLRTLIFFVFLIRIANLKVLLRSAYDKDIHTEYFWR